MSLDVSADQERLIFRYEVPPTLESRVDLLLSRTPFATISVVLCPVAESGDVHVHTVSDMFWFVVSGTVSFIDKNGDLLGELGPEQGIVIPAAILRFRQSRNSSGSSRTTFRNVSDFSASDSGSDDFVAKSDAAFG